MFSLQQLQFDVLYTYTCSIYIYLCACVCFPAVVAVCQSVSLSVLRCVVCLSVCLCMSCMCVSVCVSVCFSVVVHRWCLSICQSVCPYTYLCVRCHCENAVLRKSESRLSNRNTIYNLFNIKYSLLARREQNTCLFLLICASLAVFLLI
jgi:hypothetical protein